MDRKHPDRREQDRIPLEIFLNEYVGERLHRVMTANLSPRGIYVNRVFDAGLKRLQFGRDDRFVQLEFMLPGTGETIWARGEVRHDDFAGPGGGFAAGMVHGTGISFTNMARGHARLVREYVLDRKAQRLSRLLELVRHNRRRFC